RRGRHRLRRRPRDRQPPGPLAHRLDHGRAGRHHHRRGRPGHAWHASRAPSRPVHLEKEQAKPGL
ncbi:hypothetical protein LTR94_035718, partial [Friedmanniomyces endolithicus]